MRISIQIAVFCGVVLSYAHVTSARTWTDSTGKHKIEAELVEYKGGVVKLKRTDGKEVSLAIGKLSEADQQFLRSSTTADDPGNAIAKGADVEVNVAGKWVLAVVDEIAETPVGKRYVVTLDDSKRQMRVTDKRIRTVGASTPAGGNGKPRGERVQVRRGGDWLPATLISREGNTAMVQIDGESSPRPTLLAMIRQPAGEPVPHETRPAGNSDFNANNFQLEGLKQAIAMIRESGTEVPPGMLDQLRELEGKAGAGSTAMSEKQTSQFPSVTPVETRTVSMTDIRDLSPTAHTPISAVNLASLGQSEVPGLSRPSPVALLPKQSTFDKVTSYSVAPSGKHVAVLRTGSSAQGTLVEIVSTTSDQPSIVVGLPQGTARVFLSPDGSKLLSLRKQFMSFDTTCDLWSVAEGKLTAMSSWKIGSALGGMPGGKGPGGSSSDAYWVTDDLFVTDSGSQLVQWRASDLQPQWKMRIPIHQSGIGPGGKYAMGNDANLGVVVVDLVTGEVKSLLAKGQAMPGTASLSPSRGGLLVGGGNYFQIWDLVNRKQIVWAASPPGSSGTVEWTADEGVIAFGAKSIDLHTMSPAPAGISNQSSVVAGYHWDVADPQDDGPKALFFTPVPPSQRPATPIAPTLAANLPTYLSPGGGIAIDVQVDPEIQEIVFHALQAAVTGRGFKVDNASQIRLVATTEIGKQQSKEYGFGQPITVTWNPRAYSLRLTAHGVDYWTRRETQNYSPPDMIQLRNNQTTQQFVDEYMDWDSDYMPMPVLPDYIFPMGN